MVSNITLSEIKSSSIPLMTINQKNAFLKEMLPALIGKVALVAVTVGLVASGAHLAWGAAGAISAMRYFSMQTFAIWSFSGIAAGLGFSAVILPFSHSDMYRYTESNGKDCLDYCRTAMKIVPIATCLSYVATLGLVGVGCALVAVIISSMPGGG